MLAAFAQGFFLVLLWGAMLIEAQTTALACSGAAALLSGPVFALGFAIASRRWLVLSAAELLGPALFLLLHRFGG